MVRSLCLKIHGLDYSWSLCGYSGKSAWPQVFVWFADVSAANTITEGGKANLVCSYTPEISREELCLIPTQLDQVLCRRILGQQQK